jgi:hypothetical protein
MPYIFLKMIGGFIRWLSKGCKTKLEYEIHGKLPATWGSSYNNENFIIGIIASFISIAIIIILLQYHVIS